MLGDSFCKLTLSEELLVVLLPFNPHAWGLFLQDFNVLAYRDFIKKTFNPHAWGLFLQEMLDAEIEKSKKRLSIPMLGDSFCKSGTGCNVRDGIQNFQSPCLGTLFASRHTATDKTVLGVLSIPMLGDSFCKPDGGCSRAAL